MPAGKRLKLDLTSLLEGGDANKEQREKEARRRRKRRLKLFGAWGGFGGFSEIPCPGDLAAGGGASALTTDGDSAGGMLPVIIGGVAVVVIVVCFLRKRRAQKKRASGHKGVPAEAKDDSRLTTERATVTTSGPFSLTRHPTTLRLYSLARAMFTRKKKNRTIHW